MKCGSRGRCISGKSVKIFTNSFSHAIKISKTIFVFGLRITRRKSHRSIYPPRVVPLNKKTLVAAWASNSSLNILLSVSISFKFLLVTFSGWIKLKNTVTDRTSYPYATWHIVILDNLQCFPFSFFLKYFFIIEQLEHPFLFLQNQQLSVSSQYQIGMVGGFRFILRQNEE